MLEVVSAAVALGSLAWGWANHRANQGLEQRINTLRSSHFRLAEDHRREVSALQKQVQDLRIELRRQTGTLKFEPSMTVAEAYEMHPQAEAIFASFHLGGCASCAVNPEETIQQAASGHSVDADLLLRALNKLVSEDSQTIIAQLNRQPNVNFQL